MRFSFCEKSLELKIEIYTVDDMNKHSIRRNIIYRLYMKTKAWLAWKSFRWVDKGLICIWITWTDGKSTTSAMVYHILKKAWYKVGLISTVYIDVWQGKQDNKSHMTSLDHNVFWKYIDQAKKNWITHIVIEVSSHALYQYRTRPLHFAACWCTNLSREHLDFHRTMEHYARSKGELFWRMLTWGLGVYSEEFEYQEYFKNPKWSIETFGFADSADIWADQIQENPKLNFTIHTATEAYKVQTNIVWRFNSENMMHAALLARHVWVNMQDVVKGLVTFAGLPWRQELIGTEQWVTAMIDFAVTADGLATVYQACRSMWYNRVIAVFGATGNRDKGKRPKMWEIASRYADIALITEDENYHEDGMGIMKEVEKWISDNNFMYELVQDRTMAIRRGLELAKPWDVVVVTWMANYSTRSMNEWSTAWDEKQVILDQMESLGLEVKKRVEV